MEMGNRLALLRQSDLTRYAKGMQAAEVQEYRVVVRPDGSHEIIVGKSVSDAVGPDPDELLK